MSNDARSWTIYVCEKCELPNHRPGLCDGPLKARHDPQNRRPIEVTPLSELERVKEERDEASSERLRWYWDNVNRLKGEKSE
jgi:hypothetical protein